MNLSMIFSTKEREKILDYLLKYPTKKINMNKLARDLDLSPGQIHKYVSILRKEKIIANDQLKEFHITFALRLLLNHKRIQKANIVKILHNSFPQLKGLGIFGSWARGTNLEGADLDIWLKMEDEPNDLEIAKAKRAIERKIKVPVDLVIASPKRLKHIKEKSDAFYFSLYSGINIWGEEL